MFKARKQVGRVARHQVGAIVGGTVEFLAPAVTAVVERHHAASRMGQRLDPARVHPVDAVVGGEAVDQQDRLATVAALSARRR